VCQAFTAPDIREVEFARIKFTASVREVSFHITQKKKKPKTQKRKIHTMKKILLTTVGLAAVSLAGITSAEAQTSFTDFTATGSWNTSRWNNSADGPAYSSTFTANNTVNFTSGNYSFAGMGATINVGNINVASGANVNFATIGNTFATGGDVRTITVASGSVFDFNGQSLSTAAGTGFIKDGEGVLGTGGGNFVGGFTLNAGTVVARGTTGMGSGATNTLTLNGGTVASNGNRDFADTRFGGGITIGGNVQFGAFAADVSIASDTARVTFANNVNLNGSRRTLTLGNLGNHAFSGVISNGALTFAASAGAEASVSGNGRFDITNTANTFTGDIIINGPEVRFTADGSMGNASNDIYIDGGRFATVSGGTFTLGASRNIFIGDTAGTSISAPGAGTFTINNGIADISGKTGSWAKQGGGTLELGGVSTYTGSTSINNGILRLTTGNNRLPTGTVVSLGQAASNNLGTLDLNGRNQSIAGLQSTAGSNAGSNTNVVTSATAATLLINNSSDFAFSDGSAANSGVISGAITLVKEGSGIQTLGGVNTYTGSTTINAGTLAISLTGSISDSSAITINNGGTLDVSAGGFVVGSGKSIGGTGVVIGDLNFASASNFVFNLTTPLTVQNGTVSFTNFGFSNLIGLDSTVGIGTYDLIVGTGTTTFDFAGISNFGPSNPFDLGDGKTAYFKEGSLQVVVIPEPGTWVLVTIGLSVVLMRRKLVALKA
jgi:fibronectin-binding autotransporter adhesin